DAWAYQNSTTSNQWVPPRGNSIGVSSGKFIHTASLVLTNSQDSVVRKSSNADTGSTWTNAFGSPVVIDSSMNHECNATALAPLTGDTMLAVYDNGLNSEPNLTNLRFRKSAAGGTWAAGNGDGNVFSSNATISQNDWALVPVNTGAVYAFRKNSGGTGVN